MECLRSSHSASSTSCSLRCHGALLGQEQVFRELLRQGRAALRDAAMQDVGDRGARDADGVDAVMRIEAAVLDGDERLRQIWRQILQRDIGAGHFAARRQHAAVEADDLDGRRALWDFQRLDRRQMRADPDHDADDGDRRPQAEHRAPIDQAAEAEAGRAISTRRLAPLFGRARLALARRLVVVVLALALGHVISSACRRRRRNAVLRRQAQFGERCRQARTAAPCGRRSFSVPTPYANAVTPAPPHATVGLFKGRLPRG